ncbi:hypothetical protein AJ80_02057 [Polytolypa hystricis UAMH7299]|uniref:Uncharacterized protein n=1 Tax=Polytolypa hystricis (strain UAMH7299) TaxID=1447883 RepID=A0A2B7YRY4_POLH7|nr:hypothetical protein AJ80_02057 [Polytolypa hystricis UAMH7299]
MSLRKDYPGSLPADSSFYKSPSARESRSPRSTLQKHRSANHGSFTPRYQSGTPRLAKTKSTKNRALISNMKKPHHDPISVDLSRSASEHEGLGIYTNPDRDRRFADPGRAAVSGSHHRSTSGTSQFSTTTMSSLGKPGSQYVHPMRQTPRPFTPPLSRSTQNSVMGSDYSADGNFLEDYDDPVPSSTRETFNNPSSAGSIAEPRSSFQIQTHSMTNLPATSSLSHTYDNSSVFETTSPISRTSLDFPFRSKPRSSTDPMTRVAAVQAARQAFEDREAAKALKLEQKTQERGFGRKEKRELHHLSKRLGSPSSHSIQDIGTTNEKLPPPEEHKHRFTPSRPNKSNTKIDSPKSAWVLFLTWLRTRIFKMGKKLRKSS